MKSKAKTPKGRAAELARFIKLASEVEADESPQALDRAFARLDTKKKEVEKPAKRRAKTKNHKEL